MTQNQINEEIFILEFQNEKGVTFMQHQAKFCTGDSVIHIKNRISRDYNINLLYYSIITIKNNDKEYSELELLDDALKVEDIPSRKLYVRKNKATNSIRSFVKSKPKNKEYLETWLSKITESDNEYSSQLKINNLFSLHESDDEHVELNQIYHSKHKELSINALSRVIKNSNSSFQSLKNSPGGVVGANPMIQSP